MKSSMQNKLSNLSKRIEELNVELSQENATKDIERFKKISKEHSDILPVVDIYKDYLKFDKDISEFEACGLTEHYRDDFFAPFVKECSIKIGLKLREYVPISSSKTTLIVGELQQVLLPDEIIDEKGYLNLEDGKSMGISGLNSYYELIYKESFPYARVNELPKDWAAQ